MTEIFLYRHDAGINQQQLQKLRRGGYIPVGVNSLGDAKIESRLAPVSQAESTLIMQAAVDAIAECGIDVVARAFSKKLANALKGNGGST